jgi:hypothetical protein
MSKIAARVLKLQALAAGSDGAEAELAAKRARELMLAHALSQADIDAAAALKEDPLIQYGVRIEGNTLVQRDTPGKWYKKTAYWRRELCNEIGSYLDLYNSYIEDTPLWYWYGFRSDCTAAHRLWEICARQIDAQAKAHCATLAAEYDWWDAGMSKQAGTDFRDSAVQGLASKLRELRRTEIAAAPDGYALVVSRAAQVKEWVAANYSFDKGRGFNKPGDYSPEGWKAGTELKLREDTGIETNARPMIS